MILGEKWSLRRKLLSKTYHFRILEDYIGAMNRQSKIMLDKLMFRCNEYVDICYYVNMCSLDITYGKLQRETTPGKLVDLRCKSI